MDKELSRTIQELLDGRGRADRERSERVEAQDKALKEGYLGKKVYALIPNYTSIEGAYIQYLVPVSGTLTGYDEGTGFLIDFDGFNGGSSLSSNCYSSEEEARERAIAGLKMSISWLDECIRADAEKGRDVGKTEAIRHEFEHIADRMEKGEKF